MNGCAPDGLHWLATVRVKIDLYDQGWREVAVWDYAQKPEIPTVVLKSVETILFSDTPSYSLTLIIFSVGEGIVWADASQFIARLFLLPRRNSASFGPEAVSPPLVYTWPKKSTS